MRDVVAANAVQDEAELDVRGFRHGSSLSLSGYSADHIPNYASATSRWLRSALNPQQPDRLREIKTRHDLPFHVATDTDNRLARHIGIVFETDDKPSPPHAGWIGEVTGTGTWELPQPAILHVGSDRKIKAVTVSPDWLDRPEAQDILPDIV